MAAIDYENLLELGKSMAAMFGGGTMAAIFQCGGRGIAIHQSDRRKMLH